LPVAALGMFVARSRQSPVVLSTALASFWLCAGFFAIDSEVSSIGARFTGITLGFLLPFALAALDKDDKEDSRTVSATALAVFGADGTAYFGIAYALLRRDFHQWLGLLAVCVAATYLALAALTRRRISPRAGADLRPLLFQIGMAIAFITLAIPIQLTGFRITVGWVLQATLLTWLGARYHSPRAYAAGAIVFSLVALRLMGSDAWLYRSSTDVPTVLFNARFLAFAVSALCAFTAARWAVSFSRRLALGEYLGAHIALLAGLTLEVVMWVTRNAPASNRISAETFSVSLLYGIYAVVLVSAGVATRTAVNRISGLSLIGFVIAKLYLFDVWQLDRVYRIAAFVALGILLISTSFLYSRYRHVLEALLRNDDTAS
ncbi:MAG: DUF2339 domain-containing protein, partial [Bryobacteraceae bacterium]